MADTQVSGSYHAVLDLGGTYGGQLLFFSATPPSASIEIPDFKTWDDQGKPMNSLGSGKHVTWQPVTLQRGLDTDGKLWKWFSDVMAKGATSETKQDLTLTIQDESQQPLQTWNIKQAVPIQYGTTAANAQTGEIMVNTVTFKYEEAELK